MRAALKLGAGLARQVGAAGRALYPASKAGILQLTKNLAVRFLCSAGASWMTGIDVPVDGGFSILGPDRGVSPRVWFQQYRDSQ